MRNAGRPGGFEVREGLIRPGQDLVMAGFAGLAGTRIIGRERRADLEALFCPGFLELLDEPDTYDAERWFEGQEKNRDCPFTAYIPAGEGGVLTALWDLSGSYQAGVTADLKQIPMRQLTVEVCERYDLNPYRLFSANCVLAASDHGGQLKRLLEDAGIPGEIIGWTQAGDTRRICHGGEEAGYLERPQPDELGRLMDFEAAAGAYLEEKKGWRR